MASFARCVGSLILAAATLQLAAASTIVLQSTGSGLQASGFDGGLQNWKLQFNVLGQKSPPPPLNLQSNGGGFNSESQHITELSSFKDDKNLSPCRKALDPNSWPVKPESAVCGSDGSLYPSVDAIECFNLYGGLNSKVRQEQHFKCPGAKGFDPCKEPPFRITFDVPKLCGSDNVTHSNIWDMACIAINYRVHISVQHVKKCVTNIKCPSSLIYKPVCSTDNKTFANEEALRCEQILKPYSNTELKHAGSCKRSQDYNPCFEKTDFPYIDENVLCASNGRTYKHPKELRCLRVTNPALKVLHIGACTAQDIKEILGVEEACRIAMHEYELRPLCGSDNITYTNPYTFLCAANSSLQEKPLQLAYEGECVDFSKCPAEEPLNPSSVCGSDGVTYLFPEALICEKSNTPSLRMKHSGACFSDDYYESYINCSDDDMEASAPDFGPLANPTLVCGTNKITYVSIQALSCVTKKQPDVKFFHQGECF